MFITLGVLRWKAHLAGLTSVAVAILVAIFGFKMPVSLTLSATLNGAAFGLYPIAWIVVAAIFMYMITVKSGRFNDLRATFNLISDDRRIQAILIAFCFGGLLEALAGYGAPIAITGAMLMAVGFSPVRAALVVLLANTAPVAFGAVAIPIDTAAKVAEFDPQLVSSSAGHQTPVLAIFVPMLLVLMVDGIRGVKQTLPVSLPIGISFAIAQWLTSQSAVYQLTDVFASLTGLVVAIVILRFWQPKDADRVATHLEEELVRARESGLAEPVEEDEEVPDAADLTRSRIWMSLVPYILVIFIFGAAKLIPPIKSAINSTTLIFNWPGLAGQILRPDGSPYPATYKLDLLANPGGQLIITGILVAVIYRVSVADTIKTFTETLYKMRFAILT
ncbi:MAG: lactate permease, partial [Actinomycetales bacterium]